MHFWNCVEYILYFFIYFLICSWFVCNCKKYLCMNKYLYVWKYSETVWSKIFSFYSLVNYLKSQNQVIWMFFSSWKSWNKYIDHRTSKKKNNNRQWFLFRSSTFILRKIHLLYNISVKLMLIVICENLDMFATNDNLSS